MSADGDAALFGVVRSLTGQRWRARPCDERAASLLAQRLGLPDLLARLLTQRGIDLDSAEGFLSPRLRDVLPEPYCLKDMKRAVDRLAEAVRDGEAVAVFGDYDVDGATSAALLVRFFRALGQEIRVYIPDRLKEGYGPNAAALEGLAAEGVRLVVAVDCGTTAFEPLAAAKAAGLEVLVVDHHVAEAALPDALAVVNPNRLDDDSGVGSLAAVGVLYLLLIALNRTLRQSGYYESGRVEPPLLKWLDLVALGTVADVAPLSGLNRVLVAQGLKVLSARENLGLAALLQISGQSGAVTAGQLGFHLGPRVNAGGRVGCAGLGTRLLTAEDPFEAQGLAQDLDRLNRERQDIEAAVLADALAILEAEPPSKGMIVVAGEAWHPGVIGIVAARLRERFGLPALVIALAGAEGKGSARSIPGLDLGALVLRARAERLLINGGGHRMAAGLTVARGALADLTDFLRCETARRLAEIGYRPTLDIDLPLSGAAATAALVDSCQHLSPFGVGNPQPRFALRALRLAQVDIMAERHLRLRVENDQGGSLRAVCFRALDGPLGEALIAARGRRLHLAGKLERDAWRGGEAVQLVLEDAAEVAGA
ncbi:MAG: single-stranded-DNA-specific exonuclease RecJ [Rhodospirillales bacterium]|nr:single-stranded-DNA-specific exonuclease RecJ [Rhodospirillales bacterium]